MVCKLANKVTKKSSHSFQFFLILGCTSLVCSQMVGVEAKLIDCQEKSTKGRSYKGNANTTVDGIPCQKWSERTPHNHSFTDIGDHNFCRNPHEASESQVWCFTTDPEQERANCSVPFCPPLKALDFSLDNDMEKDENGSYTKATLKKEGLPLQSALPKRLRHGLNT